MTDQSNASPEPQRGYWVGPPPPWRTPEAIAQRRLARDIRRNWYLRPVPARNPHDVRSAADWLLPWSQATYPGRVRGLRQLLEASDRTVTYVLAGRASRAHTAKLAATVRAQATIGMAIADALDAALAARPADRPRGLQIIDEATGLRKHQARRGRTGARQRAAAGEASAEPIGEASAPGSGERPL